MHVKKTLPFSLTFLSLLALLSFLFATSALGSGPDNVPTIISLESVGEPAAKGITNAAANAQMAIQQTVPITTARTMGDISTAGEVDEYSFDATAGDRMIVS